MKEKLTNLARRALATGVRALPPLNPRLALPKQKVSSTESWYRARGQALAGCVFQPLDPPQQDRRPPARSIESEPHWLLRQSATDNNWATFLLTLPGGRLLGDEATVVTPDGSILGDVSRHADNPRHPLYRVWRLPKPQYLPGVTVHLLVPAGGLFFHWLHDVLPRLELLRRAGVALGAIDRFVIPSAVGGFAWETLAHFGIARERVVSPRYESHFIAETLLVPSLAGTSGNMLAGSCDFLRREFLPTRPTPQRKRWYISRADASYRHIVDEANVQKILAEFGFESIVLSGRSVREQAEIFASAEAIVAAHGAGLSNLVFCMPETKVLEIFAPTYVNPCYYALSARAKLNYFYLVGEGPRPAEGVDPHCIRDDIALSSESLRQSLSLMLL